MNFKRPKHEVVTNAYEAAMRNCHLYFPDPMNTTPYDSQRQIRECIQNSITMGIRAAIESLVNDTYTDEEFEEDIGLRSKPGPKA